MPRTLGRRTAPSQWIMDIDSGTRSPPIRDWQRQRRDGLTGGDRGAGTSAETPTSRFRHNCPLETRPPIDGAPRKNLDQSVEKAIQKALRVLPKGGTIWASITARGVPGPLVLHNPPPMAVPSRLDREVLIKGTFINSNVSGRSPGEIVKAVNAATKTDTAVAARRLASGDTVVTCRDSTSRPNADDTEWVQTAFGPEAAVNRRVFSVVVKGFPVRLSQNQDREVIRKEPAASNGTGIVRARARKPRGTATQAPLVIGVDNIDAAMHRDGS
ncbi:hypothetical protein E4U52_006840 [Claviceps spartinae]|nr:hypothetical protein E4U52_006840 [Claviceps spartinae]